MRIFLLRKNKLRGRRTSHVSQKRISTYRGSRKKNSRFWQKLKFLPRRAFQLSSLKIALFFVPIVATACVVFWIWDTGYFLIKRIEVVDNLEVSSGGISTTVDATMQNIFTFSPKGYEESLVSKFNYIEDVYIEKVLPDKLIVHIKERDPFVVWRAVNGAYLLDKSGYVLEAYYDENVTLDFIAISLTTTEDVQNSEGVITLEDFEELGFEDASLFDDGEKEEETEKETSLDSDLEAAIDEELKKRMTAIDIGELDFDQYFPLPENLLKYPLIKVWTDETYEERTNIDYQMLDTFLELQLRLTEKSSLRTKEILVMSFVNVLVEFEEGWRAVFRLDKNVAKQVNQLEFVVSNLKLRGEEFSEIDMRFERPVMRR